MMCKKKWSKFPPPLKNVFSLYIWEEMPSDSLYPFLKKQILTFQGNVFVFYQQKRKKKRLTGGSLTCLVVFWPQSFNDLPTFFKT